MKSFRKAAALLGALVVTGSLAQAQTTSTNQISFTQFGPNNSIPWGFDYMYGNDNLGTHSYNVQYFAPDDVDSTNGMFQLTFDATALNGVTGWGVGAGGPLFRQDADPTLFSSGDRADYILTFDAKAVGLVAGQTSANGEFQVQIGGIPDINNNLKTFQVNIPFHPTADWQTFRFSLADGIVATGSDKAFEDDFVTNHTSVSSLQFGMNFDSPFNQFGYDAGNEVYLDNVKLEVINHGAAVVSPISAKTIVDWNMDDQPLYYDFTYRYSGSAVNPTVTSTWQNNTLGIEGTVGWQMTMDNSAFLTSVPPYAGVGMGAGGPGDYTVMDSGDLANYRISFDARAGGLYEVFSTTTALQLFFDVPDNTLLPADANTDNDNILQLNFSVANLGTDWKHYSFVLNKGSVGNGSKELFSDYFNQVNTIRTQFAIDNATSMTDWFYDTDNTLTIDNIKVERITSGLQPITFTKDGADLVVNWVAPAEGTTTLQASDTVDGTYAPVDTDGTSYRVAITGTQRYFRLFWTPPTPPAP